MDSSIWDNPHTCEFCQFHNYICRAPPLLQTEEWAEWRQRQRARERALQEAEARALLSGVAPDPNRIPAVGSCPSWWPPGWPVRLVPRNRPAPEQPSIFREVANG